MTQHILAAKRFTRQTLALLAALKDGNGVYHIPSATIQALAKTTPLDAPRVLGITVPDGSSVQPAVTNRVHEFLQGLGEHDVITIVPSERADEETGDEEGEQPYLSFTTDDSDNDNCLVGFRCPECGEQDRFRIAITTFADFDDSGSEVVGDNEYEGQSICICNDCGHSATVNDFHTLHDE